MVNIPLDDPCVIYRNIPRCIANAHLDPKSNSEIYYLQSQNGNLFSNSSSEISGFEPLLQDVSADIPWATEALGEAVK